MIFPIQSKRTYEKDPNILDSLIELNLSEDQYYDVLSISNDSDFQIHLKCQSDACFINTFFEKKKRLANIDKQPVMRG